MYAIVDIAGKQYRVEQGQEVKVPHTAGEAGGNLQLDRVLLLNDGNKDHFGQPTIDGAHVDATILGHGRNRKITVFKFKRRKGYQKKQGHRQGYTLLRINTITAGGGKAKPPGEEAATKAATAGKSTAATKETAGKSTKDTATVKKTTAARETTASQSDTKTSSTAPKESPAKKKTGEG